MIGKIFQLIKKSRYAIRWLSVSFPLRSEFGYCAANVQLNYPMRIECPKNVCIYENVQIQPGLFIINASTEKIIIKKYCSFAANVTLAPNSHVCTVSIPQFLLGYSHINDKTSDLVIEEDCWLGTGCKILSGANLRRGCVVGAGSVVTKEIPPYAVVVGSPAKIIAVKFSIEQILEHEKRLYSENERLSYEYLKELFNKYYKGMKVFGLPNELDEIELEKLHWAKGATRFVEPY